MSAPQEKLPGIIPLIIGPDRETSYPRLQILVSPENFKLFVHGNRPTLPEAEIPTIDTVSKMIKERLPGFTPAECEMIVLVTTFISMAAAMEDASQLPEIKTKLTLTGYTFLNGISGEPIVADFSLKHLSTFLNLPRRNPTTITDYFYPNETNPSAATMAQDTLHILYPTLDMHALTTAVAIVTSEIFDDEPPTDSRTGARRRGDGPLNEDKAALQLPKD